MNYRIELSDNFKKEAKRLFKKYKSLDQDLSVLFDTLRINPLAGVHIGNDIYKIRMSIKSKGKGKSSGARIIYYSKIDSEIILFSLFMINLTKLIFPTQKSEN